jgi:hypothetical protein
MGMSRRVEAATRALGVVVQLSLLLAAVMAAAAESPGKAVLNGFALERSSVPKESILPGGPARDAIRSVDAPVFATASEATRWVRPDTPVIGVEAGGEAHAYPVHVMEYHQIVNDRIGGLEVVVTYDPLTDTSIAYRSRAGDRVLTFGVSGLIHRSNFLLYDRQTESLWSQFTGEALCGELMGRHLDRLVTRVTPFQRWMERHPESTVMALPEPKRIDYRHSSYAAYWISEKVPFPLRNVDERFHPKELVLGFEIGGKSRVYLGSIMTRAGARIVDEFAGQRLRIAYDGETGTFDWQAPESVTVTHAYWFAWKEFHPDSEIWQEPAASSPP